MRRNAKIDTAVVTGAIPSRYTSPQFSRGKAAYFAMARGNGKASSHFQQVIARLRKP